MSKNILGREAFFAACQAAAARQSDIEVVPCPELGGDIYVRIMTTDMIEQADRQAKGAFDRLILLVLLSVIDEQGEPMFANRDEVARLKSPIFSALSKAVDTANELKKPDEIAKN